MLIELFDGGLELNGELHQESKQEGDGEKRWRVGNWTGRTGRTEGTEWRGVTRRDFSSRGDGPEESLVRRGKRADARKSAYVCEEGSLELSCGAGKHIDVLRANFGRFSITLCNPSGFLDWSVNCASGNSLSVLTERFVVHPVCCALPIKPLHGRRNQDKIELNFFK